MIRILTFHIINGRLKIICLVTIVTFLFISISIFDPSGRTITVFQGTLKKYFNIFSIESRHSSFSICGEHVELEKYEIPLIYAITPTYYRLTQRADLTRLANTLRLVKRLHWIVVEDWNVINLHIYKLLNSTGISFSYFAKRKMNTTRKYIKGADQRNAALDWIMNHHTRGSNAVFYFVDDDNAYSLDIFEQLRCTKKLSMWPVGLSGGRLYETPIVKQGKVTNFTAWLAKKRKFPIDMAGFALNAEVLWEYHPMRFNTTSNSGFQETNFLEICCTLDDIEPLADGCTKVLVWHTRTTVPKLWNFDDDLVV